MVFRGRKKGALFFTVDTILAAITFTFTVIVIFSFFISAEITEDVYVILNNYNEYVINTKMETFITSYRDVYTDARSAKPDLAVYEQVAYLENTGQRGVAESFIFNVTRTIVPEHFGFMYSVDGSVIYVNDAGIVEPITNISTILLTYFVDIDGVVQGPNTTRISIWV